ncbi:hypothetical protein A1O7_06879 [Cladophialophora yegresii CBS 114405]|uniref:Xylanolytic transcriptional activator regulatory domain-containing protein n=1 Tax=Cladophialophora yegresii CBS 114405 TaxID=1182544 RepID=W9VU31_9EURO|nr:uncharacterized protein A1O7_06879 [Cladophialophora yegresii CBS 114405]EXJ56535.1 hypothetical protein A1O7_06879 [Cladophialophora yegresii CBS 114405]
MWHLFAPQHPRQLCVRETRKSEITSSKIELLERRLVELEGRKTPFHAPSTASINAGPSLATTKSDWESFEPSLPGTELQVQVQADEEHGSHQPSRLSALQRASSVNQGRNCELDIGLDHRIDKNEVSQKALSSLANSDAISDRVDGMGAVPGDMTELTDLDAEEIGYFGKSSTLSFVAHVQKILVSSKPVPSPGQSSRTATQPARRALPTVVPSEEYSVPPRKEADALLDRFWKKVYPLYPFLDRDHFCRQYNDVWSSSPLEALTSSTVIESSYTEHAGRRLQQDKVPDSRRFHILLNAVFAVSCSCDTPNTGLSQAHRGEFYWQRSKTLLELDFDIFNRPNLQFIQAMLYASIYLQSSTELTGACWNLVGVSIRLAQGLGLHNRGSHRIEGTTCVDVGRRSRSHDTLSCVRCRLWAGCVMMDRTLSTTYGRPAMIADTLAEQLQLLPPRSVESEEAPTPTRPSRDNGLASFVYSVRLQRTLSMITSTLYETSSSDDAHQPDSTSFGIEVFRAPHLMQKIANGDFRSLVQLEGDLCDWETSLPWCLRVPASVQLLSQGETFTPAFDVQAVALRARHLYAHILLFRPILLHHAQPGVGLRSRKGHDAGSDDENISSALGCALVDHGVHMCIKNAQELVLLLEWVHRAYLEAIPEPWYVIFWLYTCGMVFLLDRHCNISGNDCTSFWKPCLGTLRLYQSTHRTAVRSLKLLELSERSLFPAPRAQARAQTSTSVAPQSQQPVEGSARYQMAVGGGGVRVDLNTEALAPVQEQPHSISTWSGPEGEWPSLYLDDQIDFAWLGTLPFGFDSDENLVELWS